MNGANISVIASRNAKLDGTHEIFDDVKIVSDGAVECTVPISAWEPSRTDVRASRQWQILGMDVT